MSHLNPMIEDEQFPDDLAEDDIPFEPVRLRPRYDGWTAERQYDFIQALADTGCVDEACRRVGMSDTSAYALRSRPHGLSFRRAWDEALDCAIHRVEQRAIDRSVNGVARPVFYRGEQVGEWRHYDERLVMFLLRSRRQARYGKWIERTVPNARRLQDELGLGLENCLADIDRHAPEEHGQLIGYDRIEGNDDGRPPE